METASQIQADAEPSAYELLLEFLNLTPVGLIKFRPDGVIELANAAAARVLLPLSDDGDLSNLYRLLRKVAPDLPRSIERFHAPMGQICDQVQLAVPGTASVLTLDVNKIGPDTLMAVVQDITLAIAQEARIRNDQHRFRAIFEYIRDYAICTVTLDGGIEEWNRSLSRIGGWEPADVAGRTVSLFFPDTAPATPATGAALLESARQHGTAEFEGWTLRKDGSVFWGNTVATALPDRQGEANGYVLVTRDLTERKRHEDRLVALATTDPLTGASNRRAGDLSLQDALIAWQRHGTCFALLLLDCDHFKRVNDRWGHDVGDKVLAALVRICRENLREADTIIRWGGEEFLLCLRGAGRDVALSIAERLREAIACASVEHDSGSFQVTVSIGVTLVDAADRNTDEIVRRADQALYRAKEAGRNRVELNCLPCPTAAGLP
jgi:diguanylate cyclase (GGDEF)-like protein/PAS domain S-box-containing protein